MHVSPGSKLCTRFLNLAKNNEIMSKINLQEPQRNRKFCKFNNDQYCNSHGLFWVISSAVVCEQGKHTCTCLCTWIIFCRVFTMCYYFMEDLRNIWHSLLSWFAITGNKTAETQTVQTQWKLKTILQLPAYMQYVCSRTVLLTLHAKITSGQKLKVFTCLQTHFEASNVIIDNVMNNSLHAG